MFWQVMELLNHVSKRLKSRPEVQLPVDQLLAQFTDPSSPVPLLNFSLVYLRYGYPRLAPADQVRILPSLLLSLLSRTAQQDSVLQLCVPALVHLQWSQDIRQRRDLLPLSDQSDVGKILVEFLLLYLLLPYGSLEVKPGQLPPPGLNRQLITRITGGATPSLEQLEERKLAIVRLLSAEVMTPEEVVCPLIVASGDPKSSVAELGERYVRQFSHGLDWEEPGLVQQLLRLFLGTTATPGKRPQSSRSGPTVEPVSGCSLRIRIKIISFLLKSSLAANSFPQCIQLVFDGLFGTVTSPKLRSLTLEFAHHICRKARDQKLAVMAPILLTGLYKIVERPDEENKMKAVAYTGVGLLAQRVPALFQKDADHLLRLFRVFSESGGAVDRDVGLAVQECMSLLAPAYQGVAVQKSLLLEAALLENIYNSAPQARLMAALLATSSLFPFSHTPSRFVSMVACGDSQDSIREAGKKGLMLPKSNEERVNTSVATCPSFPDVVGYFHHRAKLLLKSGNCFATAAGKLPFAPAIMTEALGFLVLCLEESAGVSEEQRLSGTALAPISHYLTQLVSPPSTSPQTPVDQYLEVLLQSLGPAGDLELHSVAMLSLLQLTVASPNLISPQLLPRLSWIRGFTQSSRASVSEPAGHLLGTLSHLLPEDQFLSLTSHVYQDTFTQTHYIQLGAVVALGHLTSAGVARIHGRVEPSTAEDTVVSTNHQLVEQALRKSLQRMISLLEGGPGHAHLVSPACAALGHACLGGPLPLHQGSAEEEEEEKGENDAGGMRLITRLKKLLNSTKEIRTRELCAVALGRMGLFDSALSPALLQALFSVREEKAVELQFTVGEALSCVAAGPLSTALHSPWDLRNRPCSESSDVPSEQLSKTLDAILSDHASHPLASVRQSACIWLLCLVKHASRHPSMKNNLKRLQATFMNFLAETNEITQEVASRGLGLTYDLCDGSVKLKMVQSLVGTLMEGRRIEQKVTDDTEVFGHGELGKAPEGKGLSTYKELCSLASDLNKPDLIYKFMHLANHNALWNSKKGAAFGFSVIAATAREELSSHLPLLVPRLYRYKYDPNPRVQLAMSSIWAAVVPESKKAVDKYLPGIIDDLSQNLNSHLWRNRQASCMALGDVLVGQEVKDVASYLPSLWELSLRARDDVKETVRKAADVACKALHKVTVRACESPTFGAKVIGEVLPFMLNKGMQNPSSDVRKISLLAILKMSENAVSPVYPVSDPL
jgi:proteasome component ECM29